MALGATRLVMVKPSREPEVAVIGYGEARKIACILRTSLRDASVGNSPHRADSAREAARRSQYRPNSPGAYWREGRFRAALHATREAASRLDRGLIHSQATAYPSRLSPLESRARSLARVFEAFCAACGTDVGVALFANCHQCNMRGMERMRGDVWHTSCYRKQHGPLQTVLSPMSSRTPPVALEPVRQPWLASPRAGRRSLVRSFSALTTAIALVGAPLPRAWAAAPQKGGAATAAASSGVVDSSRAVSDAERRSPADRAAAQALFDEGRELMERGRPSDACPRFEESERLEPGLGTRFHLASCYEQLGKLASAHALFLEVASEAGTRGQSDRERLARARARAVEPRLSRLTIEVQYAPSSALRIERDGDVIGSAQWGLPVPVDPGVHRISASAPGRVAWATEVQVPVDGGVTHVDVPPLAEHRPSFFAPLSRKIGLGALGVGAGTLALGTVFAVQAMSKKDASNDAGCTDRSCTTPDGVALRRQAVQAGDRATWAMGIGLVGLGAAAALFWLLPVDEGDGDGDVQVSPVADLRSASVRVNGHF